MDDGSHSHDQLEQSVDSLEGEKDDLWAAVREIESRLDQLSGEVDALEA